MKPGQIEQVSEELAANLPVCPKCGSAPLIVKSLAGFAVNVKIFCQHCESLSSVTEIQWHPSLFEAVNIWSLTAKLLGAETPQGVANMAGDGPPYFQGHTGFSTYTDNLTGLIYYWDNNEWINVSSDVPF